MYLPLGTYSPEIKLGLVSASRNCFPRSLSEERTARVLAGCRQAGIEPFVPQGPSQIIETKDHAIEAARQFKAAGCDAVVYYLGNFSPEIEDAYFIKLFDGPVMLIAAAEESGASLLEKRGDALCGLLSAALAVSKRGLAGRVHLPEFPVVSAEEAVREIAHFIKVARVVKGIRNATVGLFGPRPRDFETCNYNLASVNSIGIEVEELGLFDLQNEIKRIKDKKEETETIKEDMKREVPSIPDDEFAGRLSVYERAIKNFRDQLKLSGAASQCWSEQEFSLRHVPCFINGRMAQGGFPIACENDCYSLIAELLGQYASDATVGILDINHSIPKDLHASLKDYPIRDMVGMFHCGNASTKLLKNPEMKYQVIMKRMMEPDTQADITRGTIEGQFAASPITVVQVHGLGDKMQAYLLEGHFLDLDPKTFGCTGTAYLPGFSRFYRHVLLGRFHHHAAVAFGHCAAVLYDAFKLVGMEKVFTPLPPPMPYPGENVFRNGALTH
ncbi:MAG: fucose isomerase [Verrucomicrobia bacterium]|nr:fucose isomerase [Verrucomicrobiota bacterium]